MKTINFRFWSFVTNEFIDSVKTLDGRENGLNYNRFVADNGVFELFTSLTDKNGKEIFEGDILEFNYSNNKAKGKVVQNRNGTWIFRCKGFPNGYYVGAYNKKMKVVGNIHEKKTKKT